MIKLDKSKLVTNLAKREKLVPFLDKGIREINEPWEFRYEPKHRDDAWHPSSDCTPSPLELYVKALAHLEPKGDIDTRPSESLAKAFMVGHYWHQLLQYVVLEKLHFCEPEDIERRGLRAWQWTGPSRKEPVVPDTSWEKFPEPTPFHWATGSGDIAPIYIPRYDWKGIVDFKTMNSADFKAGGLPDRFAAKYECQINIYMDFFDEEQALIVAVNKDSPHGFRELEYRRNRPLIKEIFAKWKYVGEALAAGEPPDEKDQFVLPLGGSVV